MARELDINVTVESLDAEAALARLHTHFLKAGDSIDEADKKLAKFERGLADGKARKQAKDELDALDGSTKKTAQSTDALTQAVLRYAAPAALIEAARRTIAWADNIDELAERTGLSTTYVQQLTKVAEKNGTTFATMANLIQASEQRLAGGNKKTIEMIQQMGMSVGDLLAMNPEERFRALARGIADIENPAKRSEAEMAIFGRSADSAAVALNKVAEGADKVESALGPDFIAVGAKAQDMWERLTNAALEYAKAALLAPAVWTERVGNWAKDSTLGTAFEMAGLHGSRASTLPTLPGAQAAPFGMPSSLAVPGDPFAAGGVGGNSMQHVIQSLRLVKGKTVKPETPVTPYTANQWANIQAVMSPWNNLSLVSGVGAGQFPGWATPMDPLGNSMSRNLLGIGFGRDSNPVGFSSASMVSPASLTGGGGFMNFLKGKGGTIAGMGMGLLSNLIPGLSRTGSSIGSTVGSLFGPLGSGIGSLAGGLFGKLFGGNSDKKEINKVIGGDAFKDLQAEATRLGISMDKVFSAKKVKDFEKAVQDVTKQIQDQQDESVKVQQAMERWGLSIEDMGKKFQQTQMDQAAKGLLEDFTTLIDAGAGVEKVIEKMGGAINEFVRKAVAMGLEVPRSMKPIVDRMYEQGLLVDENGDKLTEQAYQSIQWATTMTQGFDKVEAAINRLTNAILGIEEGFNDAAAAADNFGDAAAGATGGGGGGGNDTPGFASGGVAGRDYRRPGHGDLIPALLRRGERVLPPGVSGGGVTISGITVNVGHGATRGDFVEQVGEAVVSYMERRGARLVA